MADNEDNRNKPELPSDWIAGRGQLGLTIFFALIVLMFILVVAGVL